MDTDKYIIRGDRLKAFQDVLWEARKCADLAKDTLNYYSSGTPNGIEAVIGALGAIGMRLMDCISSTDEFIGKKDYEIYEKYEGVKNNG